MKRKLSTFLTILASLSTVAQAHAQSRPASDSELEAIRALFELDQIPEWKHYAVLEVQGTYSARADASEAYLSAEVYLEPYEVQSDLCVMEAWFRTGTLHDGRYEWGPQRNAYWNWLNVEGRDCEISDRSQVPEDAVVTSGPIPSASLSYILKNASELLARYYDHIALDTELSEAQRQRLLSYGADPSFRLRRLEITPESVPKVGFGYSATYRSPNRLEGPAVTFSITEAGFIIHAAGHWIA